MVNTDNRCRSVSGGTSASCECSGCDMAESLGYWAECTSRKRYSFFFWSPFMCVGRAEEVRVCTDAYGRPVSACRTYPNGHGPSRPGTPDNPTVPCPHIHIPFMEGGLATVDWIRCPYTHPWEHPFPETTSATSHHNVLAISPQLLTRLSLT